MRFSKRYALYLPVLAAIGLYGYLHRAALIHMFSVFLFSSAFTLILAPLCRRFEHGGLRPAVAASLSVLCFLLVAVVLIAAFVPYLVTHSIDLIRWNTPTLTALLQQAGGFMEQIGFQVFQRQGTADLIGAMMTRATAMIARLGMSAAAQTGRFAFSLVVAYYLLRERRIVANRLLLCLRYTWRAPFLTAMCGCRNALMGYLSGVWKTSLFVTAATYLGLRFLGIRDALLLSLFMGVLEILPYIGPVLAAIPILLSAVPMGLNRTLLALAVVVLVQQVEGNFISPYFTASSTSIHPLTALVSVFALGSLLGLWGILLAVPLVVTLRSVLWSVRQAGQACGG